MQTAAPDDVAPAPPPRRIPGGLVVALVLATVVLVIAISVALRSGTPEPAATDTPATPYVNGLLGNGNNPVGKPLPDRGYTTFPDDQPARLSDLRGKPVVLNFWASTCTPCITEMPDLERVHQDFGDKVTFLGLQVQDGIENGKEMVEKTGVRYPIGRDTYGEVLRELGGRGLPTTVVVAADGTVKAFYNGSQVSAAELTDVLRAELART